MPEPEIRPARVDDLDEVVALYRHLNPGDPDLDPSSVEPVWTALLTEGVTTLFVADLAGELVATCTLAIVPNLSRGARPYAVIENVVTHPAYRRRGLGRAVLQAAINQAWGANCYKVLLATGSKREATLRFYEDTGFQRDAKTYFEIRRP